MRKDDFYSKQAMKKKALSLSLVFLFILSFLGQNTLLQAEPEVARQDKTNAVYNVGVEASQGGKTVGDLSNVPTPKS